jgi:hypothetical protein
MTLTQTDSVLDQVASLSTLVVATLISIVAIAMLV